MTRKMILFLNIFCFKGLGENMRVSGSSLVFFFLKYVSLLSSRNTVANLFWCILHLFIFWFYLLLRRAATSLRLEYVLCYHAFSGLFGCNAWFSMCCDIEAYCYSREGVSQMENNSDLVSVQQDHLEPEPLPSLLELTSSNQVSGFNSIKQNSSFQPCTSSAMVSSSINFKKKKKGFLMIFSVLGLFLLLTLICFCPFIFFSYVVLASIWFISFSITR